MSRLNFLHRGRVPKSRDRTPWPVDGLWFFGLLIGAIILFWADLGSLPLRDWDEGIAAQVAREIYRTGNWLHPTTLGGTPYPEKPPLVHWGIALSYHIWGVSEMATRLFPAFLGALSVPLLYAIGRELFYRRTPAVFAALVYLTSIPVVRHGRLAMLDGAVLCFFLLLLWCILRSRRDLRYGLGVGLALSAIALTKGILVALLGAIAVLFVALDTPRLLTSKYIAFGVTLGILPAVAWYAAQGGYYGEEFFRFHFLDRGIGRLSEAVDANIGPPWYYLLELLKYAWPWLLLLPWGVRFAWNYRNWSWGKLILVWLAIYLLAISAMQTKLPWYILPVYPAIALAVGAYLAQVWHQDDNTASVPRSPRYPRVWTIVFGELAVVGWLGTIAFVGSNIEVSVTLGTIAMTMTLVTVLVMQRDRLFIPVLLWGMYVTLLSFVNSDVWIWELNESYPVKPVAELVAKVPPGEVVYTTYPRHRPSLNFYSDRLVLPTTSGEEFKKHWHNNDNTYFLLESSSHPETAIVLGTAEGWTLVTRSQTSP